MLTIYRASAGAGKTHKLTGEYLKLLFSQPGAYRRILAVTFTNKATDEMKGRIVEELYRLASGQSSDYLRMLSTMYRMDEERIRTSASQILTAILNDYSAFNISTIDRFFQQTMRAFTREIGLQGGYGIEMDQEHVLEEAIDQMLSQLDKPENRPLLNWLLRFAENKIEEGGEWSLRRDMLALGREVFKESYQLYSEQVTKDIADKEILQTYQKELQALISSVEHQAKQLGTRTLELLATYGMQPSDFKGGSRSPIHYFQKLANGELKEPTATFVGLADNPEGCFTKTMKESVRQVIACLFENGLNDSIKEVIRLFSHMQPYHTAKEIIRYYYTLGILTDISRQIAAYREEHNMMLIADTTELLHKVIAGNETPFIYEKTGTYIDHFMIDEFQDTSGMQWNNFRPLLAESLANRKENLIVGDVKQSIYRFRNSDWKLLDEQVQRDFRPDEVREETLHDNWRSCHHIVEFNNAFFTNAPTLLQSLYNEALEASSLTEEERQPYRTKLMQAYGHCHQYVPGPHREKEGHVRIQFMERDEDWKAEALQALPSVLQTLQKQGYALRDIAILIRTNAEGARVADYLLQYKEEHPDDGFQYDLISDEALYVSSSAAVRFLIAMLRYLKNPGNDPSRQMAFYTFVALKGTLETQGMQESLWEDLGIDKNDLFSLSCLPLYEMVEGLYRLFEVHFSDREQVFIQALLDMVAEYAQQESSDLTRFLTWWDETGQRKTITTPDGQNAIRILTVHKSKGLGFKAVILPFGDWAIDHKPTKPVILWCHPKQKPFNRLHLVPLRYGQILGKTHFAKEYFQERLQAFIDNLNTLYVALTRAKEELIVFAPRPKKLDENGEVAQINSIGDLLWASLRLETKETYEGERLYSLPDRFDCTSGCFEWGHWWRPESEQKESGQEISLGRLHSIPLGERLQLRLRGKNYFFDNLRRKHGTLMHELLSSIRTPQDIESSIELYRQNGIINRNEATQLAQRLHTLLTQPEVADWYNGQARVLNEVDILGEKGMTRRPDRVLIQGERVTVIDYKFGQKSLSSHVTQVKNYLKLIRQMGYQQVEGYLWYVELNKIRQVNG
ncbi:MAG: UvrD-helicase domain-containing protein [Parabacteroides sp.]